jgi:uncharacterized protein (UPF0548 family)
VARRRTSARRLPTAARWPLGIGLTLWRYMWRITPVHRWEMSGSPAADASPGLPRATDVRDLQPAEDGVGPLVHRIYRTRIVGSPLTPERLFERILEDLDSVAPSEFATFQRQGGDGRLELGDEYIVRMPGPWDGPVRVVAASATSFRLATLKGHLEAGQIEFRVASTHRSLEFSIESWARSGDRLSDLLYAHLGFAKEVQLHMWTSVLERVVKLAAGQMEGGIVITTRRLDRDRDAPPARGRRTEARLAALAGRAVNFDATRILEYTRATGWHVDDMIKPLPGEPSGPPQDGGSWQVARRLMIDYQLADPGAVRADYRADAPLSGRNMLLRIRFAGLSFDVGVRVGEVYEGTREVDGRQAQVFGWLYRTLEGHFEEGQMHYEVWKWLDTGDVEFRLHAVSRAATSGSLLLRTGFRLVGRMHQLRFYRQTCRRVRRLTESELETRRARVR